MKGKVFFAPLAPKGVFTAVAGLTAPAETTLPFPHSPDGSGITRPLSAGIEHTAGTAKDGERCLPCLIKAHLSSGIILKSFKNILIVC